MPTRNPIVAEDIASVAAADLPWDDLRGATVFVAGAAGFLPAYLVETLLELNDRLGLGVRVVGLVRTLAKATARFAHHAGRGDLRFVEQDVSRPPPMNLRADVIVHAASQASPKFYGTDPVGTMTANVLGSYHLLEVARRDMARLLYFSTSEVYGTVPPEAQPIAETTVGRVDPADVRSCYAESKRAAETLCVSYARQYGVRAVIVRPFHTYGPGFALDDGRVYADFVADALTGRDIVLKSDGSARRAFCYLADATVGFFTVLLKGTPGTPYNVGDEDGELSIRELAELVAEMVEVKAVRPPDIERPTGYLESPVARSVPDTTRLRGLGWRPTTPIREGFQRTLQSFR